MGRHKLVDVLKEQKNAGAAEVSAPTPGPAGKETADKMRTPNTEEAQVLCKLGMSQIQHSEKARKALTLYLEHTLEQSGIEDDDATAAINILKQAATTTHKELCDKVLTKYLSKFDGTLK